MSEKDIEEKVAMWEKEWQEKQAKEASEVSIPFIYLFYLLGLSSYLSYRGVVFTNTIPSPPQYFSGILLSAFE